MKKLFKIIALCLLITFGGFAPYNSNAGPAITPPTINVPMIGGPTMTSQKLCEIKQLFCGKTALAIVSFAIFLLGIMILNNKLHWSTAAIIICGIMVFYSADKFAKLFNNNILILPGNCSCSYKPLIPLPTVP